METEARKDKSKALTAFILGLFFWVPLFNLFLAIIGLVFGILALIEIKKNPNDYDGTPYAISGIVMCCLPILGGIFLLVEKYLLK